MYTPYNSVSKRDFIEQELAREYLSLPKEIDEAYSAVYSWLSGLPGMRDFDLRGSPTSLDLTADESVNRQNAGREFTYLLPSHLMKTYQTLLLFESTHAGAKASSILERAQVSLIDMGCGGGTATIGLVALFLNYQKYRMANSLPIFPVTIECVGIDPSYHVLPIYFQFIKECADRVKPLLIDVRPSVFPGTFSQNVGNIINWALERERIHCVSIAIENVIRPLSKEHERMKHQRGVLGSDIGRLLPPGWGEVIGAQETNGISAILEATSVDEVIIPLIGSDTEHEADGKRSRKSWRNEMNKFQQTLSSRLSISHECETFPTTRQRLVMIGPADCYFRRRRCSTKPKEIKYDGGLTVVRHRDYIRDGDWQVILSRENLILAWARVRNGLGFGMIEDTLEIRLFEANIEERLTKLRAEILSYQWDALSVAEMLNFRVPKGSGKPPRPMSLCRLEDQILATAILQVKGLRHLQPSSRSFAYGLLGQRKGENLYNDWYECHRRFLDAARKAARKHPSYCVIRTDILSYYTNIEQARLCREAEHEMWLYHSRVGDLTKNLIKRDCGLEKEGYGIPQGHIMSGAVAELYLAEVDRLFEPGNPWGVEYFRYVDDMIFMFPPTIDGKQVIGELDKKLSELGLNRSEEKTSPEMTTREFLQVVAPDDKLDELSRQHNYLLSELYRLNRKYTQICSDQWWPFVERYQRLLASIGVYLSIPRLSRKISKNLRWWRRTVNWLHKLRMPKIETIQDLEDIDGWRSEFVRCNSGLPQGWVDRREQHVTTLLALFEESLPLLQSTSTLEKARSGIRVRFTLNRLGQLGFGDVASKVVDLLVEQPWVLNVRRDTQALAFQGREYLLIEAFNRVRHQNGDEWAYVRASILKSFSALPTISDEGFSLLAEAALCVETPLESTMASEVLFLLQAADILPEDELLRLAKQSKDGYLAKNYALLHAITPGHGEGLIADLGYARVLNEALEYVRVVPDAIDLYQHEPDILREKYYEGDYPDDSQEFFDFPSP